MPSLVGIFDNKVGQEDCHWKLQFKRFQSLLTAMISFGTQNLSKYLLLLNLQNRHAQERGQTTSLVLREKGNLGSCIEMAPEPESSIEMLNYKH